MSALSSIEWCDRTWNPVRGCSIVSPGCVNCYAMKFAHRFSGAGKPYEGLTKQTKAGPQWTGKIRTVDEALLEPVRWKKPSRIFVNSMSDLFHEGVPDAFIDKVFAVMAFATHHTFQILTKRPQRMRDYLTARSKSAQPWKDAGRSLGLGLEFQGISLVPFPLPNVQLGGSCEDQLRYDERIGDILRTPAAVQFLSLEPLISEIDLRMGGMSMPDYAPHNPLRQIDWVIVGGESGPGARPCDVNWIHSIVKQCKAVGVPVFVKQLGSVPVMNGEQWARMHPTPMLSARNSRHGVGGVVPLALGNSKGGDPTEWPADLRVRQFPTEASR